jgi:hypothetical protein
MTPRSRGLPPNYGSGKGSLERRQNRWYLLPLDSSLPDLIPLASSQRDHMVSDVAGAYDTPVKINQDANLYVTEVTSGSSSSITIATGRSIPAPSSSSPFPSSFEFDQTSVLPFGGRRWTLGLGQQGSPRGK